MNKRLLSILLVLATVLSFVFAMSITASAEGVIEVSANLQTEITNAASGSTLKLIANITENITVPSEKEITLDLNGYVLSANSSGSVITNNGTLTVKDSNTGNQTHNFKVGSDGLWVLDDTLTEANYTFDAVNGLKTASDGKASADIPAKDKVIKVTGGCITGGKGTIQVQPAYGGGIYNNGTLTLQGGNIAGNFPKGDKGYTTYGGGVSNAAGKTFTMSAGSVIGNSAQEGGGVHNDGENTEIGIFNLEGGIIFGNIATYGGGICNSGIFNMSGGIVSANNAAEDGGGLYSSETVTISKGTISGNTANVGGGIYNNGEITMTGGSITGNTAEVGGGICSDDVITMTGGSITGNKATTYGGGAMQWGGNCTLGGTAQITGNTVNGAASNLVLCETTATLGTGTGEGKNGVAVPAWTTPIGVTLMDEEEGVTTGAFTTNGTVNDVKYFSNDKDGYDVVFVKGDATKPTTDILYNDHLEIGNAVAEVDFGTAEKSEKVYFKTVQDAIDVAADGIDSIEAARTVKLIADVNLTASITVAANKFVILDLNGHVLKGDGTSYVITNNGTLTVIDSNTTAVHYFTYSSTDAWTYFGDEEPNEGSPEIDTIDEIDKNTTHVKVLGGIITGGTMGIKTSGKLTARNVNFIGNKTGLNILNSDADIYNCNFYNNINDLEGGAVNIDSTLTDDPCKVLFEKCNIKYNSAKSGGGIYANNGIVTLIDTVITDNIATESGGGVYSKQGSCLIAGTKITMADGSTKNIEEIRDGDIVRTFDHETGAITSSKVRLCYADSGVRTAVTLHFTSGIEVSFIDRHCFYEQSAKEYVIVNTANAEEYIGKYFYNADDGKWEQLESVSYNTDTYDYYSIYTAVQQNCIANKMLSLPDDIIFLVNLFEMNEDLKYDEAKKQSDIEKYGLHTIENSDLSEEDFVNTNAKYYYVMIGKGLITEEEMYKSLSYMESYNTNKMKCSALNAPLMVSPEVSGETYSADESAGTVIVGGTTKIENNKVGDTDNNVYLATDSYIKLIDKNYKFVGKAGITLLKGTGKFTTNGTIDDVDYFFSDNSQYTVGYNAGTGSGGYLELIYAPTLYFGQNSTNAIEYSLYTDAERTKHYTDGAGTWSVEWSAAENKPQLNLNNFNSNGSRVQIDCDCIINATGTNNISSENVNGLVINQNTIIKGDGTLNISSEKDDATKVNAIASINGVTVKCSAASADNQDISFGTSGKIKLVSGDVKDKNGDSFYPSTLTTLYLAKTSHKEYALYTDYETCNFEYAIGANGAEEIADSNHYAVLILSGELDKKIIFKQDTTQTYSAVLRVTDNNTKLGSFDISDGILTVQSENGNKITVSGDIKAQKLYMVQCNGLTMEIIDGSIIAAEKEDIANELMIGSNSDTNKVTLTIKNGDIQFEKGAITVINADVTIGKNGTESAAAVGINAHRINLDGSKLTVNDVKTGIKLYEPEQYGEGAVLTVGNKSALSINATEVGVQGTFGEGGNYYNNITVLDAESTITVAGTTKAVASVAISPIPSGKIVRSTDDKAVFFKINDDINLTTDYCYSGTTDVATSLTLADATVIIDSEIENGEVTVSDQGAAAGESVTLIVTPDNGYALEKITVTDKNGTDITSDVLNGTTLTLPTDLPVTVSATFIKMTACTYIAPFISGENLNLVLGCNEAGTYNIVKDGCNGYKIIDKDGNYVALSDDKTSIVLSKNSFTWKYDGGLYTEETKTVKKVILFKVHKTKTVIRKYLSFDGEKFVLSCCKVCASIKVSAAEHTYTYLHNGDGKHEAVCVKCGHHEDPEKHIYNETTHFCKCGKYDPNECKIKDVKVYEKSYTSYIRQFFKKCAQTTYTYTINPIEQNVYTAKVEYSFDGDKWYVGCVITSKTKLEKFYIRVTDSNCVTTKWVYNSGKVTQITDK